MNAYTRLLILANIFSSLYVHSSYSLRPSVSTGTPLPSSQLIHEICNTATTTFGRLNRTFCLEVLQSNPSAAKARNFKDLAVIGLQTATESARLQQDDQVDGLKKCFQDFHFASWFVSALREVQEGDCESANYDCFLIYDSAELCQLEIKSSGVGDVDPSVWSRLNRILEFGRLNFLITEKLGDDCLPN